MKKLVGFLMGLLLVVVISGSANATPFKIGDGGSLSIGGLSLAASDYAANVFEFDLAIGQESNVLDLFTINALTGFSLGGSLDATIEFVVPDVDAGDTGKTFFISGRRGTLGGVWWGDVTTVEYGNGGIFEIDLVDIEFGTIQTPFAIQGTIKSIAESTPVPEPATMILFGIGLLGLAGVSRRKK